MWAKYDLYDIAYCKNLVRVTKGTSSPHIRMTITEIWQNSEMSAFYPSNVQTTHVDMWSMASCREILNTCVWLRVSQLRPGLGKKPDWVDSITNYPRFTWDKRAVSISGALVYDLVLVVSSRNDLPVNFMWDNRFEWMLIFHAKNLSSMEACQRYGQADFPSSVKSRVWQAPNRDSADVMLTRFARVHEKPIECMVLQRSELGLRNVESRRFAIPTNDSMSAQSPSDNTRREGMYNTGGNVLHLYFIIEITYLAMLLLRRYQASILSNFRQVRTILIVV